MNIYIDCEFDGFGGYGPEYGRKLISLALVSEDGKEFYAVLEETANDVWVTANVIPVLYLHSSLEANSLKANKKLLFIADHPSKDERFKIELERYLMQFDTIHVISDWPDDIKYFCQSLITGPGTRINTPPLTMEIKRTLDSVGSKIPHNALMDAWAIREMDLSNK